MPNWFLVHMQCEAPLCRRHYFHAFEDYRHDPATVDYCKYCHSLTKTKKVYTDGKSAAAKFRQYFKYRKQHTLT